MLNILLIKALRKQHGLTQQQVAKHLNIDRSTYAYYELGRTKVNIEILLNLAHLYEVSLDSLLDLPSQPLDSAEPIKDITDKFSCLSSREKTLVILYRSGSQEQRKELLVTMQEIVRAENESPLFSG